MEHKDIGLELRCLNNLVMRHIEHTVPALMPPDISKTNGMLISFIYGRGSVLQKEIEDEFSITRSTVSKVIKLLAEKGYVCYAGVDYDKRLNRIALTDKGVAVAEIIKNDSVNMEAVLSRGFSDEELKLLHDYLKRLQENIEIAENGLPG